MIAEFDQNAWDEKLVAAKSYDEWERINRELEAAWDAYELQVKADAQANPEHYETHMDSNGRLYTIDPATGDRVYRRLRTCEICGEKNEVEHDSWWEEHMMVHEHKRLFDLENDPLIRKLKVYAGERWYGFKHVRRWNQALKALGIETPANRAMTYEEALINYNRFSKARWGPVVKRMEEMR